MVTRLRCLPEHSHGLVNVTITKGITIRGQTTTDSDNGTANDQTILVDNLTQVPGGQGFFNCTTNSPKSLRITGITFRVLAVFGPVTKCLTALCVFMALLIRCG